MLILDADDLVRAIDNLLTQGKPYKMDRLKEQAAPRKRVLIVDDSLTVREVERKILENRGYEVTVAVDGVDGWNIAAERGLRPGALRRRHAAHERH